MAKPPVDFPCAVPAGQDPIVIAVEKRRPVAGVGSHSFREIAKLAERARGLTFRHRPVQTVLLARVAHELLCVLLDLAVVSLAEILLLRVGRGFASRDCGQLVLADPARQYLVLAGRGIEIPSTRGILA